MCRQPDNTYKVFGAGLLSSVAELKHAITSKEKIKRFDPDETCKEECIVTAYQNAYYYTESFEEAKDKLRAFSETIQRPFGVRYNAYTQSVDILSSAQKITAAMSELRGDICLVSSAMKKISAQDSSLDISHLTKMLQNELILNDLMKTNENVESLNKNTDNLEKKD